MKKNILFLLTFLIIGLYSFGQNTNKPAMILVEGGDFYMGNDYIEGALDEQPEHKISLDDFYIGKFEVTFEEFDIFCMQRGYPQPKDGGFGRGKLPVMNVSWEGAIKYCNWLSTRFSFDKVYDFTVDSSGLTINSINFEADGYRLPTESEWEYASKGGSKTQGYAYCGGNDPEAVAWYNQTSGAKPHEVGTATPNELGIYDMSGNAWEWCWDIYSNKYYKNSPETNPRGPDTGDHRVYRGGNFNSELSFLRLTKRYALGPRMKTGMVGIRLVRSAD